TVVREVMPRRSRDYFTFPQQHPGSRWRPGPGSPTLGSLKNYCSNRSLYMKTTALNKAFAAVVVPFLMIGCTTINPYTGQQQTSRAGQYDALGSGLCGLMGAAESGKRSGNAAAGCGASGVGFGAYMDV